MLLKRQITIAIRPDAAGQALEQILADVLGKRAELERIVAMAITTCLKVCEQDPSFVAGGFTTEVVEVTITPGWWQEEPESPHCELALTDPQFKALGILATDGPKTPRNFAKRMWPDSPGWRRSCNVGTGAARGVAMWRSGGAYLGKLARKGWTKQISHFPDPNRSAITQVGLQIWRAETQRRKESEPCPTTPKAKP